MKKLSFLSLSGVLLATASAYALECATPPTCAELGYTDTVANCTDAIKCPFDTTLGKCVSSATIGQIGYFVKDPGEGWLLCDGSFYHKDKYPELYAKIGTMFGGLDPIFAVPPYSTQGVFLKPSSSTSASFTMGCLPNIEATGGWGENSAEAGTGLINRLTGAFYATTTKNHHGTGDSDWDNYMVNFDASKASPYYSSFCYGPTPNYYSIGTYIYAGKVGDSTATATNQTSGCAVGNYYYADGTCSSSYISTKKMKGIVSDVYSWAIYYIYGGSSTAASYRWAYDQCRKDRAGGYIADFYDFKKLPTSISGSVTYPVSTSKTYWYLDNYTSSCTSQTSCTSNGADSAVAGKSYYYYCKASDSFK